MSAANIATIQRVYEAFGKGDVASILDMVTDDVDWASESTSSMAPWHGIRRGKTEVTKFFEKLAATAEVLDFKPLAFTANDDGDVMVTIQFEMKIPATGRSGAMQLHHWFRLRDGKIWYYRGSEDTALTAALLAK
jgi:ketosteroid isomerase-like protein